MDLRKGQATVGFSAKVPKADARAFDALLPPFGARVWFIQTALRHFLERVEKNPSIIPAVHAAVAAMLSAETSSEAGSADFQARIPVQHYKAFNKHFPGYGYTAWFIRTALSTFINVSTYAPTAPENVERAVQWIENEQLPTLTPTP